VFRHDECCGECCGECCVEPNNVVANVDSSQVFRHDEPNNVVANVDSSQESSMLGTVFGQNDVVAVVDSSQTCT